MANKLKDNLAAIVFVILIVGLGLFSIKIALGNIYTEPKINETKKTTSGIDQKVYDTISKPTQIDSTISLESGFGRENPFAPYK